MGEFRYIGTETLAAKGVAAVASAVNEAANHLVHAAQADTPVDTGTLRASIHTDGAHITGMTVEAIVQTGGEASDYAIYVHEGTAPHEIRPRNGKVLVFDGRYATVVHHPGTAPAKYIERPLLAYRTAYLATIQAAAAKAY